MIFLSFSFNNVFKFFCIIFLVLTFSCGTVYSQTVIKEKVIVNPTQTKLNLRTEVSTLSTHSVRIQVSMSSNTFCWYSVWEDTTYCYPGIGTAHVTPPGSTFDVTLSGAGGEATFDLGGTYYYSISWACGPSNYPACHQSAEIKAFVNDSLIFVRSVEDACSAWGQFTASFPRCEPECASPTIVVPDFFVTFYQNGSFGQEICSESPCNDFDAGDFTTLDQMENFQVDPCYNSTLNRWEFKVRGGLLKPMSILDICYNNIDRCGRKLLNHPSDITAVYNDPDPCSALNDILNHQYYPIRSNKYLIKDVLINHEYEHRKYYESLYKDGIGELKKNLESYNKTCGSMSYEDAQGRGANYVTLIINNYFEKTRKLYKTNSEKSYFEQNIIHNSDFITSTINVYYNMIKYLYDCN